MLTLKGAPWLARYSRLRDAKKETEKKRPRLLKDQKSRLQNKKGGVQKTAMQRGIIVINIRRDRFATRVITSCKPGGRSSSTVPQAQAPRPIIHACAAPYLDTVWVKAVQPTARVHLKRLAPRKVKTSITVSSQEMGSASGQYRSR